MSSTSSQFIEKLKGSENYHDWSFSARAYLELKKLWSAVEAKATNANANLHAKSELVLMMNKAVFPHIRCAKTAKEIWETLEKLYEDKALFADGSKSIFFKKLVNFVGLRIGQQSTLHDEIEICIKVQIPPLKSPSPSL